MSASRGRLARVREVFGAIGKAAVFFLGIALITVLLASPMMMLRSTLLAAGGRYEESEIGHLASAIAALLMTALAMHLWEDARLRDVGLLWTRGDRRNLALGLAGGAGAGLLVTAIPVLFGAGEMRLVSESRADLHNLVYYVVIIAAGSAAEELQVRGFPFQVLARAIGFPATLVLTSALFAAAHIPNPSASAPGVVNTFLFGAALGYAMWRTGSLWMPVGLHAGWNLVLPLFGANLSGLGYRLTKFEISWNIGPVWTGGSYGPEGGLLASVALAGWIYWIRRAPVDRRVPLLLAERAPEGPLSIIEPDPGREPAL